MTAAVFGMSRADRRLWASARTTADLGDLMARWLEGEIHSRPGYTPRSGPDDETLHLVPVLARLCRAGYITTNSQPGICETGADGARYEQRAWVDIVVTDPARLRRLVYAATTAGMIVRGNGPRSRDQAPVVVTTRNGRPVTMVGARIHPRDMPAQWPGLDPRLYDQITQGTYVSVTAPRYGTDGDRLWTVLGRLA
ncbi:DUF6919 domain-containing protein [Streptomyces sp. NPDC059477]|uniref:DUF6919 domain-containing protein n=1 Tax=Streptomyces sp. NPDC059477 TaxID=3346847 RepID=UPI003681D062